MKIILVCFLHLDELPPMITALKVLSEKYEILYIGVDDAEGVCGNIFDNRVKSINVFKDSEPQEYGLRGKARRFIYWKKYHANLLHVNKFIEKQYQLGDIVWIHHEHTLMHMGKLNVPYYLTMYELHPDLFLKECELKQRVSSAKRVVVPEYARAAIVQACVGLKNLPTVIENKPFDYSDDEIAIEDNPMRAVAEKTHAEGKKIILYSGIFLRERKLDTLIEAASKMSDKFVVVLIGRKSAYLDELIRKYRNVIYLGFFAPPKHLSVIKESDIGILTYVADSGSINPVFCAPNKIWEYSRFGIPMICNDIPGLKYTVEYNKFGYCCDINSVESISENLERIYNEYDELSSNAYKFYETVDIKKKIMRFIESDD